MGRHELLGLAIALVLGGSIAGFSAPQGGTLAHHDEPHPRPVAGTLEPSYRLRLTSAWPRQQGAPPGCADGGEETVEGVLVRAGPQSYSGTFTRRTRLLFCGSHGTDAGACELTLEGKGEVAMTGLVVSDETSPSGRAARLGWIPVEGHDAVVKGPCAEGFKRGVKRMYLTVRHGAEVPLPAVGAAPIKERLENYAYVAEIE
jgi:hypothetical protein